MPALKNLGPAVASRVWGAGIYTDLQEKGLSFQQPPESCGACAAMVWVPPEPHFDASRTNSHSILIGSQGWAAYLRRGPLGNTRE